MTSVGQAKSPARLERRSGGHPKSPPAGRAGTTADFGNALIKLWHYCKLSTGALVA